MLQATYGNPFSDSVKDVSFQNNSHPAFMLTVSAHIENNTTDPSHLHTDPGPVYTLDSTFDKQLQSID